VPVTLEDLRRTVERLGPEAFCARHPHPFLVRLDERGGRDEPVAWAFPRPPKGSAPVAPLPPAGPMASAHELVKQSGRGGRDTITLGRATDNDVVVAEKSISKSHAAFRLGASRAWHVLDTESRNGTKVNGHKLPPQKPHPVHSGDVILLGDVALLYLWPDDLCLRLPALCAD
jgi:hypothetical protein